MSASSHGWRCPKCGGLSLTVVKIGARPEICDKCIRAAGMDHATALDRAERAEAALERARARLDICGEVIHVLRNHDGANWRKCSARVCILNAAALSSAPDGAATDPDLTDLTMRPRQSEAGRE